MNREFTATAYILHEDKVLLHYHPKIQKWLPPGGHVEPDELPHEAAIRETLEETGLEISLISDDPVTIDQYNAKSIPRPWMCLLEEIPEHKGVAAHQHIDLLYVAKIESGELNPEFQWFSWDQVENHPAIFEETKQVLQALFKQFKVFAC